MYKPTVKETMRRFYAKPCNCVVKIVSESFCMNCLRPNEKEWREQMYYEEAMNLKW